MPCCRGSRCRIRNWMSSGGRRWRGFTRRPRSNSHERLDRQRDAVGSPGPKNRIRDPSGLDCGFHIMGAHDVCPFQDESHLRGQRAVQTMLRGRILTILCEGTADERFSRRADEQGESCSLQVTELCQQRIVFVEAFSETEAGIEYDALAAYAREDGLFGPIFEFALHQ